MVDYNASESNQWLLDWFRTQTITTGDNKSNYFRDVPSKNRRNSSIYTNSILPTITKNNNNFVLQGFLKHNDFVGKFANK